MSQHQFFRRTAVQAQAAQKLETITFPAPTRGIIQNENESFMQPGAAVMMDNWKPTMKGASIRAGCIEWCQLPETTPIISAFTYKSGVQNRMFAANATKVYDVSTTTPVMVASGRTSGNYVASQLANQGGDFMLAANDAGDPLLRFNGSTWASLATTTPAVWSVSTPYAVGALALDDTDNTRWKATSAHTSPASGTFAAARAATPGRWVPSMAPDNGSWITGPPGSQVENGNALTYVCKYRGRYFFIERSSMNAWYLPLNAVGGTLAMIPLAGATTQGGHLMFCASWSIDAGDGIDDKLVFCTDLGEIIVFTGGDPSNAANWRQEGRYDLSAPMGMNAHIAIGGDLLIATVDGIVPISAAITKSRAELELAAITRTVKLMWRTEVLDKREHHWTLCKWDEYGGIFTTFPGGQSGQYRCLVTNAATGAHARFTGWDVMCFIRMRGDMFFGTQTGRVMQADRTGYDDGMPYVCTLVGNWEVFQSPSQTVTWRQARASFTARRGEPFQPQLSGTVDYVVTLPPPPSPGPDLALNDLWDEGRWGPPGSSGNPPGGPFPPLPGHAEAYAQWDAAIPPKPAVRNTGWVSIGVTGFSHAPVVQVTIAQQAKPEVDLISIAATFERAGVNV